MRVVAVITVSLLILSAAACKESRTKPASDKQAGASPPPAASGVQNISVATATTGGAYYPIGNAIAQLWNDKVPGVKASAQATNGTPHNIQLLAKKEAEVAIAQISVVYQAVNGLGAFKDQGKQTFFQGMTYLYPNIMQWVVRRDSKVVSLADLRGTKFIPGPQNSATEISSREMLEVVGLDYRERRDLKADYMDFNQAAEQLKNKQTDAILIAGGVPTSAVLDVMTSGDGKLLSLPDDFIATLSRKYPWYFPSSIPANTYRTQEAEVKTVAVANMLIVRDDVSPDLVYRMLEAMYANSARLAEAHAAMKVFKLEDGVTGISSVVALHPGAERFFKEKGILKHADHP